MSSHTERISIQTFLHGQSSNPPTIFDVRTPAEFMQGHIPGAHNLPLFSNQERVIIGTTYAKQGQRQAILEGLDFIGPRMRELVDQVRAIIGEPEEYDRPVHVHCWRGGMRSGSVAWLLGFYGYTCHVLEGGYKAFRHHVLSSFDDGPPIIVLGGTTGSGKTSMLHVLANLGEQTIDLEALANHRGSSFGAVALPEQPSPEHFENELAMAWNALDASRHVWLEDESRLIGAVPLPKSLYDRMQQSRIIVPVIGRARRLDHLVEIYGHAPKQELIDGFVRIRKRLGGLALSQALEALDAKDLRGAAALALDYYDKAYAYGLSKRPAHSVEQIDEEVLQALSFDEIASVLIKHIHTSPSRNTSS